MEHYLHLKSSGVTWLETDGVFSEQEKAVVLWMEENHAPVDMVNFS